MMGKSQEEDRKVCVAMMSPLVVLTFQYFALIAFKLMETTSGSKVQLMSKTLVAIMFLYAFREVWEKNKNKLIWTYFIAALIFVFYYLVFPGNRTYMNEHIFPLFFMGLPAFVYARSVLDWRILKEVMKKASSIVLVLGLIVAALVITGRANIGVYSMAFSYYLLLPAIVFANESFNNIDKRFAVTRSKLSFWNHLLNLFNVRRMSGVCHVCCSGLSDGEI